MEIRHFITFKTIVEQGGFIRAAQILNYAQSSITSHIQVLEEYYGQPVFDRFGKSVRLNSFGELVYEHALTLIACYEDVCRLKHESAEPSGVLRIGVPESTMLYRLSPVLRRYKALYPKVEVRMQNIICPVMRQELKKGNLDVAVLLDRNVDEPELVNTLLSVESMSIVMPREYPADKLVESSGYSVLYTEQGCSYRHIFEQLLADRGIKVESVIETGSVEVIKQYVLCNIGVSFLPTVVIRKELEQGLLKHEQWENSDPIKIQLLHHKEKWLSPALSEFMRIAAAHSVDWR